MHVALGSGIALQLQCLPCLQSLMGSCRLLQQTFLTAIRRVRKRCKCACCLGLRNCFTATPCNVVINSGIIPNVPAVTINTSLKTGSRAQSVLRMRWCKKLSDLKAWLARMHVWLRYACRCINVSRCCDLRLQGSRQKLGSSCTPMACKESCCR